MSFLEYCGTKALIIYDASKDMNCYIDYRGNTLASFVLFNFIYDTDMALKCVMGVNIASIGKLM